MAGVFEIQGFGFHSDWNGELVSSSAQDAMVRIAQTHANSISLVPRIFTLSRTSNEVISHPDKTESFANLEQAIAEAHALGLKVLLKPLLTPLDGGGQMSLSPTDAAAFFASYRTRLLEFAELAERTGVEQLSIGNELSSLSGPEYRAQWLELIASIRRVYHGELTYAAATDEAINVSFWDAVDQIGVNAYPPLTSELAPTVDELVAAWNTVPPNTYWAAAMDHRSPVDFMHSLSLQFGRPVLLTEVGYRSADGTNIRPGAWNTAATPDLEEQRDAFDAFFRVWSEQGSWFRGAHIWEWDPRNTYSATGYSPMDKPAEQLITNWFAGLMESTPATRAGSALSDLIDTGSGNDFLSAGGGDDLVRGGAGNDMIDGGPGNDTLIGGYGVDTARFHGPRSDFEVVRSGYQTYHVEDLRTSATDGTDTVSSFERFAFDDGTFTLSDLVDLHPAMSAQETLLLRPQDTTAVVAGTYQFYASHVPSISGFRYLIHSQDNSNDLLDAYYSQFNQENRFINFSVNLALYGDGQELFHQRFGGASYEAVVRAAYDEIVGFDLAALRGITEPQIMSYFMNARSYYQAVAQERVIPGNPAVQLGDAINAVAIGSILNEALTGGIGRYAVGYESFVRDIADGNASFGIDLLVYNPFGELF